MNVHFMEILVVKFSRRNKYSKFKIKIYECMSKYGHISFLKWTLNFGSGEFIVEHSGVWMSCNPFEHFDFITKDINKEIKIILRLFLVIAIPFFKTLQPITSWCALWMCFCELVALKMIHFILFYITVNRFGPIQKSFVYEFYSNWDQEMYLTY